MSNHDVHFKYLTILSVNYTSIKPKKKRITLLPKSPRKNGYEVLSTGPDT